MATLKLEIPDHRKEEANIMLIIYQAIRDGCPILDTDLEKIEKFAQKQIKDRLLKDTPLYNKKDTP